MIIGYSRILSRKGNRREQEICFSDHNVDEVVIEEYSSHEVYPKKSLFTSALENCEAGDTIIIPSLECVSYSAITWAAIIKELIYLNIKLKVLRFPTLTTKEWADLIKWWQEVEGNKKQRNKIISVTKESENEAKAIRPFTGQADVRARYWTIFKEIQSGASLRRTAKRFDVPQGTVLRIKRDVAKTKLALWLVVTFVITVISLKIAQAYSNNGWLQLFICALATMLIIYFSYSDIKDSE